MYALLIAEDSDEAAVLSLVLQRAGLTVTTAKDLKLAMQTWQERPTDLILLALSEPSPQDQVGLVRAEAQVPLITVVDSVDEGLHFSLLELGADLVVARSGALTISELAAAGRGALLVPFAAAAGNHQEFNARSLERAGGAVVLTEHEAMPLRVAMILGKLLRDHDSLREMGRRSREVALPGAASRIADRVLSIGGGA